MEENANENYTNMHRSFLQACANLGTMEINKAKEVFQDCWSTGRCKIFKRLFLLIY